jgi:hypothetical protein
MTSRILGSSANNMAMRSMPGARHWEGVDLFLVGEQCAEDEVYRRAERLRFIWAEG